MRHNQRNSLLRFQYDPVSFNKFTDKSYLQYCLGGTLYMPGTMSIAEKILGKKLTELKSMVMCFEDAIKLDDLQFAEKNVLNQLNCISKAIKEKKFDYDDVPLIFLRVRSIEQFKYFLNALDEEQANILTGFVFPKFYSNNAYEYLEALCSINRKLGVKLFAMPILEGKSIAYCETRLAELKRIKEILSQYRDLILNVRVGGTDFSSLFGVRRGMSSSIYDILPVRDALSDILNFFNRVEDGYIVSAPVWEYFLAYKSDDIKNLLDKKSVYQSLLSKEPILNEAIDGLLREVILDKTNGMVGKTVIHPSHLKYVNAMQAVTLEEFQDAKQILETSGGIIKSANDNKMNEATPHRNWSNRVIMRAKAYGVIRHENEYIQLFLERDSP